MKLNCHCGAVEAEINGMNKSEREKVYELYNK